MTQDAEVNPKSIIYKGRMYLLAGDGETAPEPVDVDESIKALESELSSRKHNQELVEAENERLRAEVEVSNNQRESWRKSSTGWCERNDALEAKLEEAVIAALFLSR